MAAIPENTRLVIYIGFYFGVISAILSIVSLATPYWYVSDVAPGGLYTEYNELAHSYINFTTVANSKLSSLNDLSEDDSCKHANQYLCDGTNSNCSVECMICKCHPRDYDQNGSIIEFESNSNSICDCEVSESYKDCVCSMNAECTSRQNGISCHCKDLYGGNGQDCTDLGTWLGTARTFITMGTVFTVLGSLFLGGQLAKMTLTYISLNCTMFGEFFMGIGLLVFTGGIETGVIGTLSVQKYGWSYMVAWTAFVFNTITFVVGMKVAAENRKNEIIKQNEKVLKKKKPATRPENSSLLLVEEVTTNP